MRIILAHPRLDFDALASMLAAKKLYPDGILYSLGKAAHNVQEYIVLHKDFIDLHKFNYLELENGVEELILVDTRRKDRLQDFKVLLDNKDIKVTIYDHHDVSDSEILGADIHYVPLGANTTQLVEMIIERNIDISASEATVFALGIYEDTGSLSYSTTTYRDAKAVSYLLEKGANLSVVANFMERPMSDEQQELFNLLMKNSKIFDIQGQDVLIATAEVDRFIGELNLLTSKLRDLYTLDAIFSVVKMGNKTFIVARSNTPNINVNKLLMEYGGGGHDQAATATVKNGDPEELKTLLISSITHQSKPPLLAQDIMSSPVKTIDAKLTIDEVDKLLTRYGHSGFPVMENGNLVGIISRRDVEKSKNHGLGHIPVKGFMSHKITKVPPDMPVSDIRELMVSKNIGRLPVMDSDEIVGIISRSDLLVLLYGSGLPSRFKTNYIGDFIGDENENLLIKMKEFLPDRVFHILGEIAALADREDYAVFLVGGFVRDIILDRPTMDIDILVEGDGIKFAKVLANVFEAKLYCYEKFGTANLVIDGFIKIDIVTARTEYYEYPAAMPQVESSSFRQDLYRRDFTINAMAISLNFQTMGIVYDYFNGRKDLEDGVLRVMHNLSFVEDPTRLMRAIRLCARLEFSMEYETELFARQMVEEGLFKKLSYRRIWNELILALKEPHPYEILKGYYDFGIFRYVLPIIDFDSKLEENFKKFEDRIPLMKKINLSPDTTLIYFLLLVKGLDEEELIGLFEKIEWRRYYKEAALDLIHTLEDIKDMHDYADVDDYVELFGNCRPSTLIVLAMVCEGKAKEALAAYQLDILDLNRDGKIDEEDFKNFDYAEIITNLNRNKHSRVLLINQKKKE